MYIIYGAGTRRGAGAVIASGEVELIDCQRPLQAVLGDVAVALLGSKPVTGINFHS